MLAQHGKFGTYYYWETEFFWSSFFDLKGYLVTWKRDEFLACAAWSSLAKVSGPKDLLICLPWRGSVAWGDQLVLLLFCPVKTVKKLREQYQSIPKENRKLSLTDVLEKYFKDNFWIDSLDHEILIAPKSWEGLLILPSHQKS